MSQLDGATRETIESILKEDYKGPIREMLNNTNVLLNRIDRTSEGTVGKRAYVPLHISRNEGMGARGEGDDLPTAGKQGYKEATYRMRYNYGRMEFSGPAVAHSRSDEGAFARVIAAEVNGMQNDLARDRNRQLYGPSSGNFGYVTAKGGDTAQDGTTLSDPQFEIRLTTGQRVRNSMVIDLIDSGDSQAVEESELTVASAGKPFTVNNGDSDDGVYQIINAGAITESNITANGATHYLVRHDSQGHEIFGLADIVSASNPENTVGDNEFLYVGAIDRSTSGNEFWKAQEIDWNFQDFSDTIFQDAIDTSEVEADGAISIFLTTYDIFRKYGNTLLPDRRYSTTGSVFQTLDGGFLALDYEGRPVVRDRDCPFGIVYAIDETRLINYEMADWEFMDKDGSILTRVSNKDAYEATLFKYDELASDDPADHVLIKNVRV